MKVEQMESIKKGAKSVISFLDFHYDGYDWDKFLSDVARYSKDGEKALGILLETLQRDKEEFKRLVMAVADGKDIVPADAPAPALVVKAAPEAPAVDALEYQKNAVENIRAEIGAPFRPEGYTITANIWRKGGKERLYVDVSFAGGSKYKLGYVEGGKLLTECKALHPKIVEQIAAKVQAAI